MQGLMPNSVEGIWDWKHEWIYHVLLTGTGKTIQHSVPALVSISCSTGAFEERNGALQCCSPTGGFAKVPTVSLPMDGVYQNAPHSAVCIQDRGVMGSMGNEVSSSPINLEEVLPKKILYCRATQSLLYGQIHFQFPRGKIIYSFS